MDTSDFDRHGSLILEPLFSVEQVEVLRAAAQTVSTHGARRGGARNVLEKSSVLRRIAEEGPVFALAEALAGAGARPVKLTLFDKTPDANWKIRWHQDTTVAVEARRSAPGFRSWSVKEGVVHARAPAAVLESMVALRIHLDDTPASNGALKVLPATHRLGLLTREEILEQRNAVDEVVCEVRAGGVMAMRPLLLHASSKAANPTRRRILHVEYSAQHLPFGLEWAYSSVAGELSAPER